MATIRTSFIDLLYRHLVSGLALGLLCLGGLVPDAAQALTSHPAVASSADADKLSSVSVKSDVAVNNETLINDEAPSAFANQESSIGLASYTDQQIGSLLQQWPRLKATQRRDLLAEVRKRMRAAGSAVNTPQVSQTTSSLTVRIQRAKTQHRYGKPAPRSAPAAQDVRQPAKERKQIDPLTRDLVIRATVTRSLPDGSVVTSEETLVPRAVAERMATNQRASARGSGADALGPERGDQSSRGRITVVRTQVRFGAGFDRRQQGVSNEEKPVSVRTVSTGTNGKSVDLTPER